ncbi:MAG: non-canonical purine pyrophosphatase [Haloplasmataceae bacterium]|jgi:XTP/dITP diphosphohydrolase|nr:non-canonical purine pyrophosphatase [Haloplasmataceae bacterium]
MEVVFIASKNKGKIKEFQHFFERYNTEVKSLVDIDEDIEIEETGSTFEENALIKARYLAKLLNKPALADDSGLEVDVINNEPGVFSARYAGSHGDDLANNKKLLAKVKEFPVKERKARFVCALALVNPEGEEIVVRGTSDGLIIDEMRGVNGFGYDPLFYIPKLNKTMGELTKTEKEAISHRGNALRLLGEKLNG